MELPCAFEEGGGRLGEGRREGGREEGGASEGGRDEKEEMERGIDGEEEGDIAEEEWLQDAKYKMYHPVHVYAHTLTHCMYVSVSQTHLSKIFAKFATIDVVLYIHSVH